MNDLSPVLTLDNVSFRYNKNLPFVLKNINISVYPHEILAVVGPNGGGKSTLIKIMTKELYPSEGQLHSSEDIFSKNKIALVAQENALNTLLPFSVKSVIEQGLINHSGQSMPLNDVVEFIGLTGLQDTLFTELSGGLKQRVLLARAVIKLPTLLVLDEPNTGLDSTGQDQLFELINKIKKEFKAAIVIVDHNLGEVIKNADRIICLNKTGHWHNYKSQLTKDVLKDFYHCEFEHLLIHDLPGTSPHHHECENHKKND